MLCLKGVDNGPYTTTAQKDYAPAIRWRSMVASVVATFAMDEADARRLEEGLWITAERRNEKWCIG